MQRGAAIACVLLAALPAAAQPPRNLAATRAHSAAQMPATLPWVVLDLQAALAGLPTGDGWVPPVSATTPRPGHGLGLSGGAHVHLLKVRLAPIGAGVSVLAGRRAGAPATAASTGVPTTPAVTTTVTSVHPQVSLNFGHRDGWSYLSGGVGRTKIASTSSAFGAFAPAAAPVVWNSAINYGGGARWFMKPHLAASVDVRITQLGSRKPTPDYPYFALRSKLVNVLVGVSIR